MNLLKNIWYIHPYAGGPGIGRYTRPYYLAKHWLTMGIHTTVFSPSFHHLLNKKQCIGTQSIDDIKYEFVSCSKYSGNNFGRIYNMFQFTWNFYRKSKFYIDKHEKPDVIIASSPHPYIFLATHNLAKIYNAISVFEVRDLWPLSLIELAGISSIHPLVLITSFIEKFAYKKADRVVSLLPNTYEYMKKYDLNINKWCYIPNGIDSEEVNNFDETHQCVKIAKSLQSNGKFVITYAGALGRPNHIITLIKSIKELENYNNKSICLIIVGRGEEKIKLENLTTELSLNDRIFIFDQIEKKFIYGLLKNTDAGYISLRPEPIFRFGISPNKLYDYMLSGIPIIYAVISANDPVNDARCGVKVNPDNPKKIAEGLLYIANISKKERNEMGERGKNYALKMHSYDTLAGRYIKFLEKTRLSI